MLNGYKNRMVIDRTSKQNERYRQSERERDREKERKSEC